MLSILVGELGSKRDCGFAGGFFSSIFFSPFIGILVVLSSERKSDIEFKRKISGVQDILAEAARVNALKDASDMLMDETITKEEYEAIKNSVTLKKNNRLMEVKVFGK
jgi:hypothetical protein